MGVFKDKWNGSGNKWRVACYYIDYTGKRVRHEKRGFITKKQALEYEHDFLARKSRDIKMSFGSFIDVYFEDVSPQLKLSTLETKKGIINKHIRPYFEDKSLSDITSADILRWQNTMIGLCDSAGKKYSPTFLRSIRSQMSAIFNHAVNYYQLASNPCRATKSMGRKNGKEMNFWTRDQYVLFSKQIIDKPMAYYAFEILFWTGIRCGELLALTMDDFNFEKKEMSITKTYQIVAGQEMITSPKTERSNRVIALPEFLCDEIQDYIATLYKVDHASRLFPVTKHFMKKEMTRGAKKAGLEPIRIHDLRHSHCALLIELGYAPIQIANRLGHESSTITERYAHLYPSVQQAMANSLQKSFKVERSQTDEQQP